MVNLANKLNSYQTKSKLIKTLRLDSMFRFIVRIVFNLIVPLYYKLTKTPCLDSQDKAGNNIVVSLTTFPLRIGRVWIVIESILRQKIKPEKIILWLSKKQFEGMEVLPKKLLRLIDNGLEIRFVDEDIRSYKKFYYTFKEYSDKIVITIDDDILYPNYMISDLYEMYVKNPDCVIARYCYEMLWDDGVIKSYLEWKHLDCIVNYKSNNLFFGSGGGVLLTKNTISKEVLNKSVFMSKCSNADDVWLNAMVQLNGTKILKTRRKCIIFPIIIKNDITLFKKNVIDNDKFIKAIQSEYNNKVYVKK